MRGVVAGVLVLGVAAVPATPASAGLLDDPLGTVGGVVDSTLDTVGGLVGVVTAGWDDGATTPPIPMSMVADAIGADDLWRKGYDGSGVDVAVIDTGMVPVDGLNSPGKVVNGPDLSFESQSNDLRYLDAFGHGTHMAGIIAGDDPGTGGFQGVAPGARLVNIRVGAHDGAVDVSQVIAAVDWVVQNRTAGGLNIRVLNLAFGTDGMQSASIDPLAHAVEVAWRKGIVVVVGGGNDGNTRTVLTNPATDPFVLAVGAVDLAGTPSALDDVVAPFSSRTASGRTVDVVAPGVSLLGLRNPGSTIDRDHPGAVVDGRYFRGSGTSQAAAVTSGAAALLLDARPTLSPDAVKRVLRVSATPLVGQDGRATGAGRINVLAASVASTSGSAQRWALSTGTGSLEKARGTSHVADDGIELIGEQDIMGMPWNGASWAAAASALTSWNNGSWNGSVWTGSCWCDTSWAGDSWEGRSWTGRSWTGRSWTGRSWTGRSWTGRSWTDEEWTGRSWTGRSWTGRSWTSAT